MERHFIIIELDNVILKDHKEITSFSSNVLKKVSELGNKIVFTTSRAYSSELKKMHMSLEFPSIVVANAGRTAHGSDGSIILNYSSSTKSFDEALKVGLPLLKSALWTKGDDMYVYKHDDVLSPVIDNFKGNVTKIDSFPADFKITKAPSSAFCIPLEGKAHEFFIAMNEVDGLVGSIYNKDNFLIEVKQDDVSKKATVEMILSASGIDDSKVMIFAASENELDIVREAAFSFVMINAPEYVKLLFSRARETESSCNNDGVAKELIKFFNISM